jgi:hypothetical protein
VGLLALLALLGMGALSYCIFLPDPVEEAKERLAAINKSNLDGKERSEKKREVMDGLTEKQKFDLSKARRAKNREKVMSFLKLSPEEQIAEAKKEQKQREERQARREAMAKENGGNGGNGGGAGGGGQAAGGQGRGGGAGGDRNMRQKNLLDSSDPECRAGTIYYRVFVRQYGGGGPGGGR